MTVRETMEQLELKPLAGNSGLEREAKGCYIGDLLSWVMSRCAEGDVWITVMGNVNGVAVAALADAACIILCENAPLDEEAKKQADANGVAVFSSPATAYGLACKLHALLGR